MVRVIKRFKERNENLKLYEKGDTYTYKDKERVAFLIEKGYLEEDEPQRENIKSDEIKHTGGGWYELPNGEKVKGKEKALEALGGE